MPTYSGLFVRDNWSDTGVIPASGDLWLSPDVIPYGARNLSPATAVSTYGGPDIGTGILNNSNNNIYVRCKNISGAMMTGSVKLFYAKASLFLYPTTWIPVVQPVADNRFVTATTPPSATIPEQGIALVQAPFVLGGIPTTNHYCFICVVNNNNIPFNVPASFQSNAEFAQWVGQNPNVAWRNIASFPGSAGSVVAYTTFGNANPVPSNMVFTVQGTNVPANTAWSASCNDIRLPQPFSAKGTFSSSGAASTPFGVPAHVTGGNDMMTMAFTFTTPNGQPFPTGTSFVITYYQVPVPLAVDEVDDDFRQLEALVADEYEVATSDGSGSETITLILLGSVFVYASPTG